MPKVVVRGSREPESWEEGAHIDAFRARTVEKRRKAKEEAAQPPVAATETPDEA